jgi:hypothetical protein
MAKSQDIFIQSKLRHTKPKIPLTNVITARSWAMYEQIASSRLAACGVVAATCTKTVQRRGLPPQSRNAATASWPKVNRHIWPTTVATDM